MIIIIMGVSGAGKSTIGKLLAKYLNWDFFDGDSFHSQANIKKMSNGIPLNDADRIPWLIEMRNAIEQWLAENQNIILACSALKKAYRHILITNPQNIKIVYLKGSFDLFAQRLRARKNHFMKLEMLQSQFDVLEEPKQAIIVDAAKSPEEIVNDIIQKLCIVEFLDSSCI
ncbi:MAG: gluconokinase [Trichodesmium sp. MO_231.B1]|nr:gluconokinase [Trichodesmium sp. MO_231.B1]